MFQVCFYPPVSIKTLHGILTGTSDSSWCVPNLPHQTLPLFELKTHLSIPIYSGYPYIQSSQIQSEIHGCESFSAHPGITIESTSQAFFLSSIFFILYSQWVSTISFPINPFPWISTLIPFSFLLQQFVKQPHVGILTFLYPLSIFYCLEIFLN